MKPSEMNSDDLNVYRNHVEQMFNERSATMISNRSTSHAKILIETLVTTSTKSLDILCDTLCGSVYGTLEMASKIASAVDRGVKIRILTQQVPEAVQLESQIKALVKGDSSARFRMSRPGSQGASAPFNFVVCDKLAFRFEMDKAHHIATASANNRDLATKMALKFDELWREAKTAERGSFTS